MNKSEFVDSVASRAGIGKSEASRAVDAVVDVITDQLRSEGEVNLTGFGKFSVSHRGERQGVNPQTGERITIAASKAPKFSAGSALKKTVKGG